MRALHRFRQHLDILETKMRAGKAEALLGPGAQHDLHGLVKARRALRGRHPEILELGPGKAVVAPDHLHDPTYDKGDEQGLEHRSGGQEGGHGRPVRRGKDERPRCHQEGDDGNGYRVGTCHVPDVVISEGEPPTPLQSQRSTSPKE